jgi:hypothetical protein
MSGCQRLPSGNTIICESDNGRFFEVTPDNEIVWEYENPYPNRLLNMVFNIEWLSSTLVSDLDCYGNLNWKKASPGSTLNDTITVENNGDPNSLLDWEITDYPDWGIWFFSPENGVDLTPEDGKIYVDISVIIPNESKLHLSGILEISNINYPDDVETIPIIITTSKAHLLNIREFLIIILEKYPLLFQLLR